MRTNKVRITSPLSRAIRTGFSAVLVAVLLCAVVVSFPPVGAMSNELELLNTDMSELYDEEPTRISGYRSLTTGKFYYGEMPQYNPVGLMIENSPGAQPQWGLQTADVVYEAHKDFGNITRFFAIFNDNRPELAGPIRSTRVYWLRIQQEWDCIFANFGGPRGVDDTNIWRGQNNGHVRVWCNFITGFGRNTLWWREYSKELLTYPAAPCNVLCSIKAITEQYPDYEAKPRPFIWSEESSYTVGEDGKAFTSVKLPFYFNESCTYYYNEETGLLERHQKGKPHLSRETGKTITVQNLIVQQVDYYRDAENDKWHYRLVQTGTGIAYYFIGGVYFQGTWSRPNLESKTTYYDKNGEEIVLIEGNTWIEIHPDNVKIVVK